VALDALCLRDHPASAVAAFFVLSRKVFQQSGGIAVAQDCGQAWSRCSQRMP
jgi:hypothetical protein